MALLAVAVFAWDLTQGKGCAEARRDADAIFSQHRLPTAASPGASTAAPGKPADTAGPALRPPSVAANPPPLPAPPRTDGGGRTFDLPVLTVTPDHAGACPVLRFTLDREAGSAAPPSVSVEEDTPGGAGEALRASVWAAAMVAALERGDDMAGVRVSLRLPGLVDGPSAGGAVCLAVMGALDGRRFPADCVMTGTVMPDGTVGRVAGIPEKLRAAAAAGLRRVLVPAYLRFDADPATGAEIDLKRLAGELKLQLLPVENVAQAYAAAFGIEPAAAAARPGRDALDLPVATEELLKKNYTEQMAAGTKLWDAIPEQDRAAIAAQPLVKGLLIDRRAKAESAYRSGKLLFASGNASLWAASLLAREQNVALFANLPPDDFAKAMAEADRTREALLRDVPAASALLEASVGRIPESAAQLCADYCDVHQLEGLQRAMQRTFEATSAEATKPENQSPERRSELLQGAENVKASQLWLARVVKLASANLAGDAAELAATLPGRQPAGDPARAERLFYSAFVAAHNSFATDVIAAGAADLRVSPDQALGAMAERDASLAMYLPTADAAMLLHRDLSRRATESAGDARFVASAAAHVHASNLAAVSGLIARWGELDVDASVEGQLRYGRTDLLNYLLSAARENALASIAECRRRDIPCIEPIAFFETAELGRDDPDEDKVDVLSQYWNASLQSKVSLMLFTAAR